MNNGNALKIGGIYSRMLLKEIRLIQFFKKTYRFFYWSINIIFPSKKKTCSLYFVNDQHDGRAFKPRATA